MKPLPRRPLRARLARLRRRHPCPLSKFWVRRRICATFLPPIHETWRKTSVHPPWRQGRTACGDMAMCTWPTQETTEGGRGELRHLFFPPLSGLSLTRPRVATWGTGEEGRPTRGRSGGGLHSQRNLGLIEARHEEASCDNTQHLFRLVSPLHL